jgi:chemotaxis protein CheX
MMEIFETAPADLDLPPVLDLTAASGLLEAFLERRGQVLAVDGSNVQRLGAQCLQVLLAARMAWEEDGQTLCVENCSEDFLASLELMGVTPETLTYRKELAS